MPVQWHSVQRFLIGSFRIIALWVFVPEYGLVSEDGYVLEYGLASEADTSLCRGSGRTQGLKSGTT